MSESHLNLALHTATVDGAVAGDLTVAGIREGDVLRAVQPVDSASPNLVEDFEITGDDTITGSESTDLQLLLVIWIAAHDSGGRLDRS